MFKLVYLLFTIITIHGFIILQPNSVLLDPAITYIVIAKVNTSIRVCAMCAPPISSPMSCKGLCQYYSYSGSCLNSYALNLKNNTAKPMAHASNCYSILHPHPGEYKDTYLWQTAKLHKDISQCGIDYNSPLTLLYNKTLSLPLELSTCNTAVNITYVFH